ncbi:MAG: DNA-directed DNA polymerase II small subunit [Candidatus Heimdallarchaeota archaeon]
MSTKRNLVKELLDRNCLITPDSYEILEDIDIDTIDIDKLANALKNEIVVTGEKLQKALSSFIEILSEGELIEDIPLTPVDTSDIQDLSTEETKLEIKPTTKKTKKKFIPLGKSIETNIKILRESTEQTIVDGTLSDFNKYFTSRYNQIREILRRRGDLTGTMQISGVKNTNLDSREVITIIGMVYEKRTLKSGGLLITIEDPTGRYTVNIVAKEQELVEKAGALLNDQVAGFVGKIYDNRLFLDELIYPNVPIVDKKSGLKDPISICMTSDLHIGSKEFLEKSFLSFIDFLNGKVDDPYQQTLASQIKYMIICGDLVDGIGIYPKQEDDLVIDDIYEQYKYAAKLIDKIPKWIHIIIISGNHDACRLALPQPAFSKEYAPDLWAMENVTILSNPSTVEIHGRKVLLFHGNSFEDVSSLTPGLSMSDPNGPMIYTLRFRHLAPTYGRRSSIVPSKKDELVIEIVPDLYVTGHIHINSHTQYRGIDCINAGTFQSQTDYMLSKNINPTPGRVPVFNLQTNKMHELVFYHPNEQ